MALPNTPDNEQIFLTQCGDVLLPGDEFIYWSEDLVLDGVVEARKGDLCGVAEGDERSAWRTRFYDRELVEYDWFQVGPTSYTFLGMRYLQEYWEKPRVATRGAISHSLALLNLPCSEYRRYWRRPYGYKRGRWHVPWSGGRRGNGRVARRQDIKRWLYTHERQLLLAEAW
jgi:hypothetical protein